MIRRTFVVAGLASSACDSAPAATLLKVIYVGGWDCQPCTAWKNKHKADWLASPEYKRVTWIEVEAPKLKEAYRSASGRAISGRSSTSCHARAGRRAF